MSTLWTLSHMYGGITVKKLLELKKKSTEGDYLRDHCQTKVGGSTGPVLRVTYCFSLVTSTCLNCTWPSTICHFTMKRKGKINMWKWRKGKKRKNKHVEMEISKKIPIHRSFCFFYT